MTQFDQSIQKFKDDFQEILNDFPEFENLFQIGYSGVAESSPITGVVILNAKKNSSYDKTEYYYQEKDLSFLHFTSIKSLLSILSSQSVRLRTLNGMNDVNEINYVAKQFNYSDKEVKNFQKGIFSFSLVQYISSDKEITYNTNNLDLWRFYGLNGEGVAIKFRILNDPLTWHSFHMSSILYGEKNVEKLKKFKERIDILNSVNPIIYNRLQNMFSFHKSNHFKNEDEIRLIYSTYFNDRKSKHTLPLSHISADRTYTLPSPPVKINNSESYFMTIPLTKKSNNDTEDGFFSSAPKLIIEDIILGYKFKEDELKLYQNVISSVIESTGGIKIEPEKIYITELKDLFHD